MTIILRMFHKFVVVGHMTSQTALSKLYLRIHTYIYPGIQFAIINSLLKMKYKIIDAIFLLDLPNANCLV